MIRFELPSLGADMDEGTLLEWKVRPGEAVARGQVIAVVDTSKAAVDVEIWQAGTVAELLVQPGQKIPVGTVMATLTEAGEATVGRPKTDANSGEAAMPAEEKKGKGAASADAGAAELGSKSAPVRADNPAGQRAYLQRLRCPDGSAPSFERQGSMGYGGYGHIVDLYKVRCESTGRNHEIYMDMDFPGYVETQAVKGFTLTDD